LSATLFSRSFGALGNNIRLFLRQALTEGDFMKVVLVKSPKLLSGFLRLIFGIKKNNA